HVINGRRPRRSIRGASGSTSSRKHDKHDSRSDTESESCSLLRSNRKAKDITIKVIRATAVRNIDRKMTEVLGRDESLFRRLFQASADLAKRTGPTAIFRIRELDHESIRITHEKFGSSFFCAAICRTTRFQAYLHGSAAQSGICGIRL